MYCEKCGKENERESTFCVGCGAPLRKEEPVKRINDVIPNQNGMYFSKEKYLGFIHYFETSIIITYVLCILAGAIVSIGIIGEDEGLILLAIFPPLIGWFIAWSITLHLRIRVEEMKWKIDFYSKYI